MPSTALMIGFGVLLLGLSVVLYEAHELSTGTSALVLHVTIVAALCTNVALPRFASSVTGEGFAVPLLVGVFVVVRTVFLGGAVH